MAGGMEAQPSSSMHVSPMVVVLVAIMIVGVLAVVGYATSGPFTVSDTSKDRSWQ